MAKRVRLRGDLNVRLRVSPGAQAMRTEGLKLIVRILNRTASGRDENNRRFEPYSPAYLKRFGGLKPGGVVDLNLSGDMLRALDVLEASETKIRIGFSNADAEVLAGYHDRGAGRLPVRQFLGIPPSWLDDLVRRLRQSVRLG